MFSFNAEIIIKFKSYPTHVDNLALSMSLRRHRFCRIFINLMDSELRFFSQFVMFMSRLFRLKPMFQHIAMLLTFDDDGTSTEPRAYNYPGDGVVFTII